MVDIDRLLGEMTEAADRMRIARDRLKHLAPDAPNYQSEKVDYLHALVSHMSMVAVAQAEQHQELAATVDRLEEEMKIIRERFAAITRPTAVWP
jgi:tripartite-type tricarboxylate transporter receptor subunit TctC